MREPANNAEFWLCFISFILRITHPRLPFIYFFDGIIVGCPLLSLLDSHSLVRVNQEKGRSMNLTPSDSQHSLISHGWFGEKETMWPGQKFCIEVEEVLLNGRSKFQVWQHQHSITMLFDGGYGMYCRIF